MSVELPETEQLSYWTYINTITDWTNTKQTQELVQQLQSWLDTQLKQYTKNTNFTVIGVANALKLFHTITDHSSELNILHNAQLRVQCTQLLSTALQLNNKQIEHTIEQWLMLIRLHIRAGKQYIDVYNRYDSVIQQLDNENKQNIEKTDLLLNAQQQFQYAVELYNTYEYNTKFDQYTVYTLFLWYSECCWLLEQTGHAYNSIVTALQYLTIDINNNTEIDNVIVELFKKAVYLCDTQQYSTAIQWYQQIIQLYGRIESIIDITQQYHKNRLNTCYNGLAICYIELQQYDNALKAINQALQYMIHIDTLYNKARLMALVSDGSHVRQTVTQLVQHNSFTLQLGLQLMNWLNEHTKLDHTTIEQLFDIISQKYPNDLSLINKRIQLLVDKHSYDAALNIVLSLLDNKIRDFKQRTTLLNTIWSVIYSEYKTNHYTSLNKWIDCYQHLILDNTDADSDDKVKLYRVQSIIAATQNKYTDALQYAQHAYQYDSESTISRVLLIRALLGCNNEIDAIKLLTESLDKPTFSSNVPVICLIAQDAIEHNLQNVAVQAIEAVIKTYSMKNEQTDDTDRLQSSPVDRIAMIRTVVKLLLSTLPNEMQTGRIEKITDELTTKLTKLCDTLNTLIQVLRTECSVTIPTPTITIPNKSNKLLHKLLGIDVEELKWFTELCYNISLSLIHTQQYTLAISILSTTYSLVYILNDENTKNELLQQICVLYGSVCIESIWSSNVEKEITGISAENAVHALENALNYEIAGADTKHIVISHLTAKCMLVACNKLQESDIHSLLKDLEQIYKLTADNYDYIAAISKKLGLNHISTECLEQSLYRYMNAARIDTAVIAKRFRTLLSSEQRVEQICRLAKLIIDWSQQHTAEAQGYPSSEAQWIITYIWNSACIQYQRNELYASQQLMQCTVDIFHVLSNLKTLEADKYKKISDTNAIMVQSLQFQQTAGN